MALNSIIPTLIFIAFVFLFMRFFGQGCLTMVSRVAIGKWFNHHRGLASAISGVFVAVGFNSSPLFLNVLVMHLGWQTASLLLAICVGIGMSLIGWVFFRDNPEQCNLQMDGELSEEKIKKLSAQVPETKKEFTRSEASRTLSFWAFTLGIAMVGLIITAVTFHITSIGAEKGLDRNQSYQVFLWIFPFSIIANFFASWISDRIRHKWILFAMMIAQMISQFGLLSFESFTGRFLFSAGQGCAGGIFVALSNVVYPRFFGREHLGEINGLSMSVLVFASAIGPVLFSGFRNIFGSYQVIFWISIIIPITIILLGLKAENPQLSLKDE
jgi:MFS family permease